MIRYRPGESLLYRLDPRAKLLFQIAFAVAVFTGDGGGRLIALTGLALVVLLAARCSLRHVLWSFRLPLAILALAPAVAVVSLRPPGIDPIAAIDPTLAGSRVVLVLLVSAAYVRTTSLRESRAAVQRLIPGRAGALLGVGIGLTIRLLPVLRRDLGALRDAEATRLGDDRSVIERARTFGIGGVERALSRADRLAVALRARCFAWNPTLPPLAFAPRDGPVLAVALVLFASAFV